MTKLRNLLFAGLLTAAAIVSAPRPAAADHCTICARFGYCMPCCRCEGGTVADCTEACNP